MSIAVKLEAFEGPLDLLLHLIEKNKVNIYDIPIVEITEQYLSYVSTMDSQDLNVVSEFLVMAATLIDIKSRMLLPKEVNEEGEEIDPRQELVERLLEYKKFKYIAEELKDKQTDAERYMFRPETLPPEVAKYEEPVDIEKLLSDVTLKQLHAVFQSVMKRQSDKIDPVRSKFGRIEKEEVSLPEKMAYIEEFSRSCTSFSFRALLGSQSTKMEVIVTFLAVLELIKVSKIRIEQDRIFDDIRIYAMGE